MNFFKQIAELMQESYTLQMVMKMKNGKMTVTFIPTLDSKEKDVVSKLVPLSLTHDPEELDRTLILTIQGAMSATKDFAEALKEYEGGLNKAKKELDKKQEKPKDDKPKEDKPKEEPVKEPEQVKIQPEKEPEKREEVASAGSAKAVRMEDIAGEELSQEAEEIPDAAQGQEQTGPEPEPEPEKYEEEDDQW